MPTPEKDKSLETWIWDAACSIRGAQDAAKYKDFILPLIFTKRLCGSKEHVVRPHFSTSQENGRIHRSSYEFAHTLPSMVDSYFTT